MNLYSHSQMRLGAMHLDMWWSLYRERHLLGMEQKTWGWQQVEDVPYHYESAGAVAGCVGLASSP